MSTSDYTLPIPPGLETALAELPSTESSGAPHPPLNFDSDVLPPPFSSNAPQPFQSTSNSLYTAPQHVYTLPSPPTSSSVQLGLIIDDPYPGFPTVTAFEAEKEAYLGSLDQKKKRAKALVDSDLYDFVRSTLLHPQDTTLRSAQDRFWARATFTLARKGEEPNSASAAAKVLTSLSASKPDPSSSAAQPDPSEPDLPVASTSKAKSKAKVKMPKGSRRPGRPPVSETATALVDKDGQPLNESQVVLIHDGLPVVKAEEIYELLVRCHAKVEHGGREKTFKEVKAKWSWVPKDLAARFVKVCPTCCANTTPGTKWRNKPLPGAKAAKTKSGSAKKASTGSSQVTKRKRASSASEGEEVAGKRAVRGKGKGKARAKTPEEEKEDEQEEEMEEDVAGEEGERQDEPEDEDAEGESEDGGEGGEEDEFVPISSTALQKADGAEASSNGRRAPTRATRSSAAAAVSAAEDSSADLSRVSAATLLDSPSQPTAPSPATSPEQQPRRRPAQQMTNAHLFQSGATLPLPTNMLPPPPPPPIASTSAAPPPPRPTSSSRPRQTRTIQPRPPLQPPGPVYTPYQPFASSNLGHSTGTYTLPTPPSFPSSYPSNPPYTGADSTLPNPYSAPLSLGPAPTYRPYPFPYAQQSQPPPPPSALPPPLPLSSSNGLFDVLRAAAAVDQAATQTTSWSSSLAIPLPPHPQPPIENFQPFRPPSASTYDRARYSEGPSQHRSPYQDTLALPLPLPLAPPVANPSSATTASTAFANAAASRPLIQFGGGGGDEPPAKRARLNASAE